MKHLPFESIYRQDFQVVEQRQGNTTLYPHTDQLPVLLRALKLEFYGGLPDRIARVDHRGDGFHKIALRNSALVFCAHINAARPDGVRLFQLLDRDLVSKIAIVQQITEHHPRGLCHRFRFYAGEDFFEEIYLSGKRVVFADHVLQRFSTRVPNHLGEDLSKFLLTFYGSPTVSMPTGPGRAFMFSYHDSILALTYKETDSEYFITTCLTVDELHSLEMEVPTRAVNLHYGTVFSHPRIRNWFPLKLVNDLYQCWERKVPLPPPSPRVGTDNWHKTAGWVRDVLREKGHGPGSRICFLDNIPGPCCLQIAPGQTEPRIDEIEIYKKALPGHDWDELCA